MVGQVIRVVEVPISLSIGVARRSVALAGRVAGWALTGIVREISPDRGKDQPPPAAADRPAEPTTTLAGEPAEGQAAAAATEEREPTPPIEEERDSAPGAEADEQPAPSGVSEPQVATSEAAPSGVSEPEVATSGTEAEPPPVGGEEAQPALAGDAGQESPPIGGEDGAVVEHEPGIGTSVRSRGPHSALNNPITEADLTEWPDPYDHREDPRDPGEDMVFGGDAGHTQTGATSTSEPHPSQDPEAEPWEGPKRDKVDQ